MEKKKFKALTLVSGISTIIFGVMLLVGVGMLVLTMLQGANSSLNSSDATQRIGFALTGWILIPMVVVLVLFLLGICITEFVLGAFLCGSATKSDKQYLGRSGFLITTIVFDFILTIVFGIITYAISGSMYKIVFGVLLAVSLLSGVLKIVDLSLAKKRMKLPEAEVTANPQPVSSVNFNALKANEENKINKE